jgi:hypothetical protein
MASHEPNPEFRAHLEWQIETALRRGSRFADPVASGGGSLRRLRTAIVVAVALAVGGAAGIASERVQDVRARNELLESARAQLAVLQTRHGLAMAELNDARRRYETGAAGREELAEALRRANLAEVALERHSIDMREIEQTSMAPRDELTAPRVGSADFVGQRLKLELGIAQRQLASVETALKEARNRFEAGLTTRAALVQAEMELTAARHEMQQLHLRLELREKFLHEELQAAEVLASLRRSDLMLEAELTTERLQAAKRRLVDLRALVQIGTATPLDAKRAEVEVLELEMKLQNLQRQLKAIGKDQP